MHKSTLVVLLSLSFVLASAGAEARNKRTKASSTTASETIETHQAAPSERHGGMTFDLGYSSMYPIMPFTVGTTTVTGGFGSVTGILHFTPLDAVQILASIPTTQGGFTFGLGGLYKRTLIGNEACGFHVGGGIAFGTYVGNFAMTIPAIAGFHYQLSGTEISFHFDGGAAFGLVSVSGVNGIGGTTVTNFAIGPNSGLLGASVVYGF
jgi:hypothetical protein